MESMNAFPNIGNVSGDVKKCLFWTISGETPREEMGNKDGKEESITSQTLINETSGNAEQDKISQLWQSLMEKRLRTNQMLKAVKTEARKQSKDTAVWKESRSTLRSLLDRLEKIGKALMDLKRLQRYLDGLRGIIV